MEDIWGQIEICAEEKATCLQSHRKKKCQCIYQKMFDHMIEDKGKMGHDYYIV